MTPAFRRTIQRILNDEPVSKTFPIKISVSYGKSEDALVVQFLLYRAGYPLEQDGAFGHESRIQLRAFQKKEFGWLDGVCSPGRMTIHRLVVRYLEYVAKGGVNQQMTPRATTPSPIDQIAAPPPDKWSMGFSPMPRQSQGVDLIEAMERAYRARKKKFIKSIAPPVRA